MHINTEKYGVFMQKTAIFLCLILFASGTVTGQGVLDRVEESIPDMMPMGLGIGIDSLVYQAKLDSNQEHNRWVWPLVLETVSRNGLMDQNQDICFFQDEKNQTGLLTTEEDYVLVYRSERSVFFAITARCSKENVFPDVNGRTAPCARACVEETCCSMLLSQESEEEVPLFVGSVAQLVEHRDEIGRIEIQKRHEEALVELSWIVLLLIILPLAFAGLFAWFRKAALALKIAGVLSVIVTVFFVGLMIFSLDWTNEPGTRLLFLIGAGFVLLIPALIWILYRGLMIQPKRESKLVDFVVLMLVFWWTVGILFLVLMEFTRFT